MKAKFRIFGLLIVGLACFSMICFNVGQADAADNVIKWKMQTHWPASSSSFEDSAKVVVEKLKKRTNGRLDIELYPSPALVPPTELFDACKRGMLPIIVTSSAYPRDQVPLMDIASGLPMNFKNVWEIIYFNKWLGFDDMVQASFNQHGLYYVPDKVYPTELSCKKPIKSIDDFKGLKLRSSGILQVYLSSIGAAASMLPGSEIYTALSSGVIDGAHWGAVQGSDSMKFYEVSKYHLRTPLNFAQTDIWLVNIKAMEKLPQDIQDILKDTLEEHFWLRTNQYQYQEEITLAKIQKEKGVTVTTLPDADYNKMKAAAMATWDEAAKRSPENAKAVQMLKDFLVTLGR
ncbi:TRAP transporter substrate-binding protein DctP [Desulfatitalea tepidiphila]|uniref:TRAP transporter substrate-binding protein DctP n=1 Tax=Desulfatitalea tepidiphila TaxID=1185843 RepID=UPI0006B5A93F|nr:TRAP transporter substrate-binding protein DctP [Desulfatitalea tepidiphila]